MSRCSATLSGVSTNTSQNSPCCTRARAIRRSARNGEMKDTSTIRPASTISLATSATRRMFSTRSASVKPRSLLRPWRTLSPSSRYVWRPSAWSFFSTRLAIVDLPAPDSPVNHTTHGWCPLRRACACLLTSIACQWMFCDRRSAKCSRPAPIVFVGQAVDQDEAAGVAVLRVGVEGDRLVEIEIAHADLVQVQRLRGQMLERVDVDLVLRRRRRSRRRSWPPIFSR